MSLRHFDARKDLLKPQRNLIYLSEEKSLRHVAMVAKILDDNKQNKPLKSLFALFQTSAILVVALAQEARLIICNAFFAPARWGGRIGPYLGYLGMCRAKGYVFFAVLVWKRVSISTILVWKRVWFVHSSLELGMFFRRISYFFII